MMIFETISVIATIISITKVIYDWRKKHPNRKELERCEDLLDDSKTDSKAAMTISTAIPDNIRMYPTHEPFEIEKGDRIELKRGGFIIKETTIEGNILETYVPYASIMSVSVVRLEVKE